jgi:hypothetical protein
MFRSHETAICQTTDKDEEREDEKKPNYLLVKDQPV